MKTKKSNQKGFNLVEVCIGILILAAISIVAVNLIRARTTTFELNEANRGAIEVADEMLDKLSAQAPDMPDGGTFSVDDARPGEADPTILASSFRVSEIGCSEQWCDYVLNTPESSTPNQDQPTTADDTGSIETTPGGGKNGIVFGENGGGGGIIVRGGGKNEPKPSALGGLYPKPKGSDARFFRRWSVKTIDAELKLKVITVAILTDETATEPLLVEQTIVGSTK